MERRDRLTRVVTSPTPDGPAYYPFGSWGHGYVLDAPTRATLDAYLRRIVWIMIPCYPLSRFVGEVLGLDRLMSAFAGWLVFCAVHAGVTLFILRHCGSAGRARPEELLRLSIAQRGHLAVESSYWCGLIVGAGAMACAGLALDGAERLFFVAAALAGVMFAARQLWRIKRLDAA